MTGVAFNTVKKLLIDAGRACARYQHDALRNLPRKRLRLDEVWSFVYAQERNVPPVTNPQPGMGSTWTWVAIDAETKRVPSWLVGPRDGGHACAFVTDRASRSANRVQITTDGLRAYVEATEQGFGGEVDYAILHKVYGATPTDEARYSPAECVGCQQRVGAGNPDLAAASTSYIERQNLTAEAEPAVHPTHERIL